MYPINVPDSSNIYHPFHPLTITFSPVFSDGCTDGTMASSSNDSHYSGSRVETPVSYMGDEDDEEEYDENDDED